MENNSSLVVGLTKNSRISINLEDLLLQEDKLWRILENIRTHSNFNFSAEDYIEFSQITSIQDFLIYFPEPKSRIHVNKSCMYEYISVMFCIFIYLKNTLNGTIIQHLKNILYVNYYIKKYLSLISQNYIHLAASQKNLILYEYSLKNYDYYH